MTPEEKQQHEENLRWAKEALVDAISDGPHFVDSFVDRLTEWVAVEANRIVEERLASLTLQGVDCGGKWLDHPGFRVKPKAKEGE